MFKQLSAAITLFYAATFFFTTPLSHADTQREVFLRAYSAAKAGEISQANRLKAQLNRYPLTPYITYEIAQQQLQTLSSRQLSNAFTELADSPLQQRLLSDWLAHLGKQNKWPNFFAFYPKLTQPSAELQCLLAVGHLHSGRRQPAYQQGKSLWVIGRSQVNACDPLFDSMIRNNQITSEMGLERALLALENDQVAIAQFAERFVQDAADKSQLRLFKRAYQNPRAFIANSSDIKANTPQLGRLIGLLISRLAKDDLEAALQLWADLQRALPVNISDLDAELARLGVLYAKRFNSNTETLLSQVDPLYRIPEITEWRIRFALTELDWPRVSRLIEQLPNTFQQEDVWRYWSQIARIQQGLELQTEHIVALLNERSFYGFKTAELINRPFALNLKTPDFTQAQLFTVSSKPGILRMEELYFLGLTTEANREWRYLASRMQTDEIHAAAHLFKSWGWYFQAIVAAAAAERWDDLHLRFPAPFEDLFDLAANEFQIEPSWALAVTRQESAFLGVAQSHVGARGLMQLMPATAKETAQRSNIPLSNLSKLNQPDINIRLGSAYLAQMQSRFQNNLIYATAAYNAGPGRVNQWVRARGHLPLDIWIETIPFDETHKYVKNVLTYVVIYNRLADKPTRLFRPEERLQLSVSTLP